MRGRTAPPGSPALHALEAAAFRAWPALEEQDVEGWRLRFAGGYTRRANSVNAGPDARLLEAARLDVIEAAYRARGLPPVFRLVGFSPAARAVDATLEARGYRRADPCLVMAARLADARRAPLDEAGAEAVPAPATRPLAHWLEAFRSVTGQQASDLATHATLLRAIDAPTAMAVDAASPHEPVDCCGLGVVVDGTLGLFDVATRPPARGRGAATRLCGQLMAWGRAQGAATAWLQVLAANAPARRVYERLGFRTAYEYWYRVKD